ncbi:Hypothetical_protein [Hexamita inflata]|uniref:Hypothetical_protein n=1 Tax=Hexamita inflata TaxID=28002 RepID=A0ABP1KJA8_9EUKA
MFVQVLFAPQYNKQYQFRCRISVQSSLELEGVSSFLGLCFRFVARDLISRMNVMASAMQRLTAIETTIIVLLLLLARLAGSSAFHYGKKRLLDTLAYILRKTRKSIHDYCTRIDILRFLMQKPNLLSYKHKLHIFT